MKLAALVSGGKDSVYAAYLAQKQGHEIKHIVSVISQNPESYMFHVPNAFLAKQQAAAMEIPIIQKVTEGMKEIELNDLEKALVKIRKDIDGIVSGAVASVYQKSRLDAICKKLGLKHVSPLWAKEPEKIVKGMIADGFEVIITAVAAPPLDEDWLGRKLDKRCLDELMNLSKLYGIHPLFEGGEGETFVLYCPMFNKRIKILESEKHWDKKTRSGHMDIKKVRMAEK